MYENEGALLDSTSLLDETNSTVDFEATNEVLFFILAVFFSLISNVCIIGSRSSQGKSDVSIKLEQQ